MKAFLSHSSMDKEFVRAVAKYLGRQYCVVDEQAFSTGEQFKKSIEDAFDQSSVFVLFASRHSLDSIWVKFETEEAWFRKLRNTLYKSLVYIIDSSIESKDLPEWLQRGLIKHETLPKSLARDIRLHLNELLQEKQHIHFVGRGNKIEEIEQNLTPLDGKEPPHAIFITGLPGIGRRSIIKRTTPTILNLKKFVEIRVGESDSINDICVSVADHAEAYSTKEGFENLIKNIRNLSDYESLQRILRNIRMLVGAGELPLFIDEGGLVDSEGFIREQIKSIVRELAPNDEAYIFFVSTRKPRNAEEELIPVVQIMSLNTNEIKRLILLLARNANLDVSYEQVNELAEYVAGYPPSAYFAVHQAKDYGIDLLLSDKTRLVEFQTSIFLKHLSTISLNDDEQRILRLMASYSPLPLPVIANFFSIALEKIVNMLVRLIDLALLVTTEEGYYRLADPVSHAVVSAFGFPDEKDHKKVATLLYKFLENDKIDTPLLELSRVLFRAALWAKDEELAKKTIHLSNDLIKITESYYHARKFRDSINFGFVAVKERPESVTARSYLIRALIQEERFNEAEKEINEIKKHAPFRDVYFLKGFLERRKGNFHLAIDAYKEAEELGRTGVALSRELAFCYYMVQDYKKAMKYVEGALMRDSNNQYVLDLWAQIATQLRDEDTARKALDRLELINKSLFYYHRLSRVELSFGNLPQARTAAIEAVHIANSPPFEVIAQLICCEIEMGNLSEAIDLLNRLDKEHGSIRQDIRIALRCRIENAQCHFSKALDLSEQFKDKSTIFWKKLRRDALFGELRKSALKDKERENYEKELSMLEKELDHINIAYLSPCELDVNLSF